MSAESAHLLRHLDVPNRPANVADQMTAGPGVLNLGSGDAPVQVPFERLIHLAVKGELASGRPVRTAEPSSISKSETARIAAAMDRAEAAGARRAVALMDGKIAILDIRERRVLEEITYTTGSRTAEANATESASNAPLQSSSDPLPLHAFADAAPAFAGHERILSGIDTAIILTQVSTDANEQEARASTNSMDTSVAKRALQSLHLFPAAAVTHKDHPRNQAG